MFRSGGPIKEGIMDGMQDRPQQLVQPAADGSRPGYAGPLAFLAPLFTVGGTAARVGATRAAPSLIPRITQGFKNIFQTQKPAPFSPVTIGQSKGGKLLNLTPKVVKGGKGPDVKDIAQVSELRPYFASDPTISLVRGTYNALTDPKAKGLFAKGARFVLSPTGVITTGYFAGGKFFDKDGNQIDDNEAKELGLTAGSKIDEKVITGESDQGGVKLTRDEEIEANRKRYYKLMGIDKLNKEAAYNTLIDASNQIREGGNIKDQLKSGSLASNVINALSKNLDRSVDLKKQIDAAILKGEITKDINKEKNQSEAELRELQKKVYQKKLDGSDLDDIAAEYRKSQLPLKGQTLFTEANRAGTDVDGILSTKEVDEFLNENPTLTEADYIEKVQKDRLAKGEAVLPEGNYVVGGRIVHISDGGLVDRFVF